MQTLKDIWQKLKELCLKVLELSKQDILSIWNNTKFFLIPLIILGLIVKFRDIIISVLVSSSKKVFKNAQDKNKTLQTKEDNNNKKADDLVKQANGLTSQEGPVAEDWYKK